MEKFFERIIENAHLPLEIEKADYYEDTERKIDFIVHISDVGVVKKDVGVQLTIGQHAHGKNRQVTREIPRGSTEHIDKRILVKLPLEKCHTWYLNWQHAGKFPGGPTKLWDRATKEMVFRGVLKDILPKEKINEMWEKVKMSE